MKYFTKLAEGFDVMPAVMELAQLGAPVRRLMPFNGVKDSSPVGQRNLSVYAKRASCPFGGLANTQYEAVHNLYLAAVAAMGDPEVGQAIVRIMPPHSKMKKHRDGFDDLYPYRRHHLVLQADEGAVFTIRDESCRQKPGELWHVDIGNRMHFVVNDSPHERIALMIDTLKGTGRQSLVTSAPALNPENRSELVDHG